MAACLTEVRKLAGNRTFGEERLASARKGRENACQP